MPRYIIFLCLYLILLVSARKSSSRKWRPMKKIVGGHDTEIEVVPYQVSIIYAYTSICGGSIVNESVILTAAHCVTRGSPQDYIIRAGTDSYAKGGVAIRAYDIIRHENYNPITSDCDIAIIKLRYALPLRYNIEVVPLATKEPHDGDVIVVSGWGRTHENGIPHKVLQSVEIPVVERNVCRKQLAKLHPITNNMICAGFPEGRKDSCRGDSGGPAVSKGLLVGVVSFGIGCGRKDLPGVYVNVARFKNWIQYYIYE